MKIFYASMYAVLICAFTVDCITTSGDGPRDKYGRNDREYAEMVLSAVSKQARTGRQAVKLEYKEQQPEFREFLDEWRTIAPDGRGVNIMLSGSNSSRRILELFWDGKRLTDGYRLPIENTILTGVDHGPDHVSVNFGRTSFPVYNGKLIKYWGVVAD